jgi:hypothetical protein
VEDNLRQEKSVTRECISCVNSPSPFSIKTKVRRLKENKGDLNIGKFEDSL